MINNSTEHGEITHLATKLMSTYFQNAVRFSTVTQLSERGRRNLILRLKIENPTTHMPKTIILKKTDIEMGVFENKNKETEREQFSRFARDWAGLEFLTQIGGNHAPHFYAGNIEHQFILIEDLGLKHHSLVAPLTRIYSPANLQEATLALINYAQRLGKMHANTAAKSQQFTSILYNIYPQAHRLLMPKPGIAKIMTNLKKLIGVELQKIAAEIDDILEFSLRKNEFNVLLHGDICPDNVYYQNDNTKFIDFEFGDFGNALIDGVYPRMSMPSCWCSKAIPDAVVHHIESVYRKELISGIAIAADDNVYHKQLVYACAYWAIRTIHQIDDIGLIDHEWVCPSGPVDPDSAWESDKNTFRPRILSRLEAFITCAKQTGYFPSLCEATIYLLSYLRKIWPQTQCMDVFPVFKREQ